MKNIEDFVYYKSNVLYSIDDMKTLHWNSTVICLIGFGYGILLGGLSLILGLIMIMLVVIYMFLVYYYFPNKMDILV